MRAKGEGSITKTGYHRFKLGRGAQKMAHVLIAEKALGRPLPPGVQVHHVNENKGDNRNENLVICPSASYHRLIHQRMAAYAACGNANWRKCRICKFYDEPARLIENSSGIFHATCLIAYSRWQHTGEFSVPVRVMPDNQMKCPYCKKYDDPKAMRLSSYVRGQNGKRRDMYYHVACRKEYSRRKASGGSCGA